MEIQYKIAIIWLAGFLLSFWMLRAEHDAEGNEYTNGDQVICVSLSVLSFGTVLYLLVIAWVKKVGKEYWSRPVKNLSKNKKAE